MKIGIFGGSFNPPHLMHKNIGVELIEKGYLDRVIYVPTGGKYPKDGLITDRDRYLMVERMIMDNPLMGVDDYEFGKLTYTYQTLDYFKNLYKDDCIYFITGTDNFREIDTWKNYRYLLSNYWFIVIPRNGDDAFSLVNEYGGRVIVFEISYSDVSSTKMRDMLRRDRYSKKLSRVMDSRTLEYIYDKDLYL